VRCQTVCGSIILIILQQFDCHIQAIDGCYQQFNNPDMFLQEEANNTKQDFRFLISNLTDLATVEKDRF